MIVILGEVMLDKYTYGVIERINPEAPVPILLVKKEENYLGGAGNVAKNICGLHEEVLLISTIKRDNAGKYIKTLCAKNKIKEFFVYSSHQTIIKHRFIASGFNQQILRVDYEKKI